MKKGTTYVVVAAMMMGLMLTGCGDKDSSERTTAEVTTESGFLPEISSESDDTEDVSDYDDTEDYEDTEDYDDSDIITKEDTEDKESEDDTEKSEADASIVGEYTETGYKNEYFGFQVDLGDEYTLVDRSNSASSTDVSDIVEASNSDDAIQTALENVDSSFTTSSDFDFSANDGTHYILIRVKSPKGGGNFGYDVWADEESIVKANQSELENIIRTTYEQAGVEVGDIESDYSECEIFGEKHYMCYASAQVANMDYSIANIIVRSDDGKYEATIVIESLGDTDFQSVIDSCFSPL